MSIAKYMCSFTNHDVQWEGHRIRSSGLDLCPLTDWLQGTRDRKTEWTALSYYTLRARSMRSSLSLKEQALIVGGKVLSLRSCKRFEEDSVLCTSMGSELVRTTLICDLLKWALISFGSNSSICTKMACIENLKWVSWRPLLTRIKNIRTLIMH